MFSRNKKERPSPLPLTRTRTADEQSLPPYSSSSPFDFAKSPFKAASSSLTPFLNRHNPLAKQQQQVQTADDRSKDGAAPTPASPFSPFAPFSPVEDFEEGSSSTASSRAAAAAAATEEYTRSGANCSYAPAVRSSLYQSESAMQYMDPEAATAMGIHQEVLNEAESGVSEDEIERRRARAQRRLERQQREDEGSVVEDLPTFRQVAKSVEV